jgi:hypothetical protein
LLVDGAKDIDLKRATPARFVETEAKDNGAEDSPPKISKRQKIFDGNHLRQMNIVVNDDKLWKGGLAEKR